MTYIVPSSGDPARSYATVKALRAGETIEFEGALLVADENTVIQEGDTYIAQRNTGPHLFTALLITDGYIVPMERGYPFDEHECVKVKFS